MPEKLIVDPRKLPQLDGHTMEIAVSYPNGSATTRIKTDQICPLLSDAYDGLISPKAREKHGLLDRERRLHHEALPKNLDTQVKVKGGILAVNEKKSVRLPGAGECVFFAASGRAK